MATNSLNRKKNKVVIFAQSYGEIENCLYVVKENLKCKNSVTIVIPGLHDFYIFMQELNKHVFHNKINIIYFDFDKYRDRYLELLKDYSALQVRKQNKVYIIKWVFQSIRSAIEERTYNRSLYKNYLSELKGSEIYFFTRFCVPYNLYVLKKLSKSNNLIYMYITRKRTFQELDRGFGEGLSKVKYNNLRDILKLLRLKIVYGLDSKMIRIIINNVPYIPDNFMKKNVYKIISQEESNKLLENFDYNQFNIFNVHNYKIIYFDQRYFYRDNLVDTKIIQKEINSIFNILSKYFTNEEIAIKYHPGDDTENNKIKIGTVLDNYIPAEYLYNDYVKIYLSFSSGSLGNVEKGLAVSLIDLVTYKTEEIREKVKKATLKKSYSNILFPKSLDDFERIVISVLEKT